MRHRESRRVGCGQLDHTDANRLPDLPLAERSEGAEIAFPLADDARAIATDAAPLKVFTTRADTIMGVTFVAVAPEHPLAAHAATHQPKLAAFIEDCQKGGTTEAELALKEKEGMPTGLTVTHPLTGQAVPVWVGNYVLMSYGDGAVMGVPAHDQRDLDFARKYMLPVERVVALDGEADKPIHDEAYTGPGHLVNSRFLDGMAVEAAKAAVIARAEGEGWGAGKTVFRLRDWGVSRQRYWGTPIPVIHCDDCGVVGVPKDQLPVKLPEDLDYGLVTALSFEARQKLNKHRPETLGQASRISGITPASISLLLIHLRKGRFKGFTENDAKDTNASTEAA